MKLFMGDCLHILQQIQDQAVDMVLADLPYGTTACKWDNVIPFEPLWEQLHRICKPNAAMCMFGLEPFSTLMRMSNLKRFKYDWIWRKSNGGFVYAKYKPLVRHENISIFSEKPHRYFPQMIQRTGKIRDRRKEKYIIRTLAAGTPQSTETMKIKSTAFAEDYDPNFVYPISIQEFANAREGRVHPTQKPVALLEYLIKTYTTEGDTVLDPTMGSGSTGVACKNTNRKFIGVEKDETYFKLAQQRIESHMVQQEII